MKGTLHCIDPLTLEELYRNDISEFGCDIYSVTGVGDTLYFVPMLTAQDTFNQVVCAYNISTEEIRAIKFSDDVFHIFLNGDQRAGFHKIVAAICYQVFHGLPGFWKKLHLIEDDDRLASFKDDTVYGLQLEENEIQVRQVIEQGFYSGGGPVEVNQQVGGVFVPCKFLDDCRLADTPGPLD